MIHCLDKVVASRHYVSIQSHDKLKYSILPFPIRHNAIGGGMLEKGMCMYLLPIILLINFLMAWSFSVLILSQLKDMFPNFLPLKSLLTTFLNFFHIYMRRALLCREQNKKYSLTYSL